MNWLVKNSKYLSLFALLLAIGLVPSFSVGTLSGLDKNIELRLEDFLLALFAVFALFRFLVSGKRVISKPLFSGLILIWLSLGFFTLLVNFILGNLSLIRGFFFFLKELEFFLIYFFVFYYLKNSDEKIIAKIARLWFFVGLANIAYVLYQVVSKNYTGEYGAAALAEWGVYPTGAFFLMLFAFLFNFYLYRLYFFKKGLFIVLLSLLLPIGVFASASKTNFLGLLIALLASLLLFALKTKKVKMFFFGLAAIAFVSFLFWVGVKMFKQTERITFIFDFKNLLDNYYYGRLLPAVIPQWQTFLQKPLGFFIGLGKGVIIFRQESHNQYLRTVIETGFFGLGIFLLLFWAIIKKGLSVFLTNQDYLKTGLAAGLLTATIALLFMGLAVDFFIVVKPNEVYWFWLAMAAAVFFNKENRKESYD